MSLNVLQIETSPSLEQELIGPASLTQRIHYDADDNYIWSMSAYWQRGT